MGYKIPDVKADIHEDVEAYFNRYWPQLDNEAGWKPRREDAKDYFFKTLQEDILDIVDKHFEKIER